MKKNINIVLIGVLTVASIILALPFTPLRNSFKGVTSNAADKALSSFGVDLKGKISNARKISSAHQYEVNNLNLGLIVDNKGRIIKSNGFSNTALNQDDYNMNYLSSNDKSANSNGLNSGFSSTTKNTSNSTQKVSGFVSISTKLENSTNTQTETGSITKQSGNNQNDGTGGGTHPGVDPPGFGPSPSLPLGNGTVLMLLFAIAFGTWKARKLIVE